MARTLPVEQFIQHYMRAVHYNYTRDQLADELSLSPLTIYLRASELRRQGIPLPPLPARTKKSVIERAREEFERVQAQLKRINEKMADKPTPGLPSDYDVHFEKKMREAAKRRREIRIAAEAAFAKRKAAKKAKKKPAKKAKRARRGKQARVA